MKKMISIILSMGLVASLSACGGGDKEITMQEIYDASYMSAMLENHESVYIKNMEGDVLYEESYASKDCSYTLYGGEYYGMASDSASFTTDSASYSYNDGNYMRTLILSQDGLADSYLTENDEAKILGIETLEQTIQSVTEKDGRITVVSSLSQDADEDSVGMGLISTDCEYVLDAETRELISSRCVYSYDDGSVYDITSEFFYDADIPEGMKAFMEYDQQAEDLRTITVVSNPGAENEKSESVQVPKGLAVSLEPAVYDGTMFDMYADAACTESFAFSDDNDSDATIYVKWSE